MPKTSEEKVTNQKFAFIMSAAFFILGFLIPLIKKSHVHWPLIALSLIFLFAGVFCPLLLNGLRLKWMKLGTFLGHVNSTIIYSFLYLTLFSFIHLIFKLTGRDKLIRKWRSVKSTFKTKESISLFNDPF